MPQQEMRKRRTYVKRKKKKENIIISVLSGLLPWKGDSPGEIMRKSVLIVSLAVLVFACGSIINFYFVREVEPTVEREEMEQYKEENASDNKVTVVLNDSGKTNQSGSDSGGEVEILEEYLNMYNENNDFVGWVQIYPYINYPVAQGEDNDFYLKHNFKKVPTLNGTIFADYECVFTPTERAHNTILYGHNLLTHNGFQPLANYRKSIDFLKSNPTINFDTLYERGTYKIFSVFLTNTLEYHGEIFKYWNCVYFNSRGEFYDFVSECLDRSYYYTDVDIKYGDEFLTLSTCDFSALDELRLVIVARRVREDENPSVNTEGFTDNSGIDESGLFKRKMFDSFYAIRRSTGWAGRNWDTSLVEGFDEYLAEKGET